MHESGGEEWAVREAFEIERKERGISMTVEETMSNILCNPSVKLLSANDGKVISPIFNDRHKDYDLIKDMEINSFFARIETPSDMQDYARIVYCIYLNYSDVIKIAEHRKAEKHSAHKRGIEKAKKKLEGELT